MADEPLDQDASTRITLGFTGFLTSYCLQEKYIPNQKFLVMATFLIKVNLKIDA